MTVDQLNDLSILSVITGSTMYGLDVEGSDVDIKNVVKVPFERLLTLGEEWETTVAHDPDIEFHSLKKMVKLLNSQNPTVLEMIFAEPQFILKQTDVGKELIDNRHLFLSQNCYHTFSGYARDQLMRIKNGLEKASLEDNKNHLKYHMDLMVKNLPKKYTEIKEGKILIKEAEIDHMGKANVIVDLKEQSASLTQLGGMFSEMNASLRQYNKVNNRNRKPEKKLHKHAMHLARLVITGTEVQKTGDLKVSMKDRRKEMIAIRNGEITWEEFFVYADDLFDQLEQARKTTVLPEQTDYQKIEQLYKKLQL